MPGSSLLPRWHKSPENGKEVKEHRHPERRLKSVAFVPNWVRNEFIAFCGEFGGTFMFLFMAFAATQVANASAPSTANTVDSNSLTQLPDTSNLSYISLAFGFSLVVNVWAFFRISGGLFNPAVSFPSPRIHPPIADVLQVTLGLLLIGAVKPRRAFIVFIAQITAAIAAAGVVQGLFPGPLNVSTTLGSTTTIVQGLFIEMFLTAELVFVVFMLAAEKHKATFLAPVGIGLALFVCELCGVYFTGGSLNPARSFGPAVVNGHFDGYHWIYWLGPCLGTLLAFSFFRLMKTVEYETANPGQDLDDHEAALFDPPEDAVTAADVSRPHVASALVDEAVMSINSGRSPTPGEGRSGGRMSIASGGSPTPNPFRTISHTRGSTGAATVLVGANGAVVEEDEPELMETVSGPV